MPKNTSDIVLGLLRKHPDGLTVTEVSKILDINYMTASKYLAILEAVGKVECRKIGMAKLFGVKK